MPTFDIIKKSIINESFRVASVMGKFDLKLENSDERFVGNINLTDDWQIGLIVGNSGTGKTTIAKELFSNNYITDFSYNSDSVIDDFNPNNTVNEIINTLNSVGFSSPPSWLKPYGVLSNGEKMRVNLARALLDDNELIVFDEFTSVVDRAVAKIGSCAVQKAIRRTTKKFIAVSCHNDIEDWLMPDWVFNTNTMQFTENIKKKDLKSDWKYSKQKIRQSGECLVNTII